MSVFFFLIGSITASFICCMVERTLKGDSLLGRSHCDYCGHVLHPSDLLPVLSYLFLKGHCRYCGRQISIWLFFFELSGGCLFMALFQWYGFNVLLYRYLIFFSILMAIAYHDMLSFQIPDVLLIILILNRIIFYQSSDSFFYVFTRAFFMPLFLLFFSLLFYLVRKKQPMGFGDIKLFYVLGCYFSIEKTILILFVACLTGMIYCLVFQRKKALQPFPFVPFIYIGTLLSVFFGQHLITWYLLRIAQHP